MDKVGEKCGTRAFMSPGDCYLKLCGSNSEVHTG